MEISIITVFGSYNHGSYLQALNLSKALSKYGNVQFIDYNTRQWNAFRTAYRRTKLFLRSSGQYNKFAKIACFEIREAMIIKKQQKKTVHSDKFSGDVCVLGSDEIWNIKRSVCRYPVYWGDGIACPKIAYAPSINNSTEDEFEKNAQYITYLNNIDSISVRTGILRKYCHDILEKESPVFWIRHFCLMQKKLNSKMKGNTQRFIPLSVRYRKRHKKSSLLLHERIILI